MIIAIDGHSSCGKSTLAKDLAKSLQILYIDSGAMYRAVCVYCLQNHIDSKDIVGIHEALPLIQIKMSNIAENDQITLNGQDISIEIRTMAVSNIVSDISAISAVRRKLVELQRNLASNQSVVMDGRDIGTVVFPNADYKFFITANIETRTLRRFHEMQLKGIETSIEEVRRNLLHRDHIDSTREDSPLLQAQDAITIDTSDLTRLEQLNICLSFIQPRTIPN